MNISKTAIRRTPLEWAADHASLAAVIAGMCLIAVADDLPTWVGWLMSFAVVGLYEIGHERMRRYRLGRDKMRAVAIGLVRQWPAEDRADALDWVPADVLAAGTPILTARWPVVGETEQKEGQS